jgi:lipopolysaccharide export system permease protein
MRILSRYLLKEHLGPFLFAFGALTGLLVLNQLARQFGSLVGKGLSWSVIGEVFLLSFPFILAMTIPMACLVAVLHAFSRLGSDNEITALKASGVDLTRLVRPVLLAGVVVSLGTFAFVDQLLPRSNHRLKNLLVDIARKKPTFELKEQMVNEVVPSQVFLRAGRIDQSTNRLRDVVIYDLANEARKRTIYADSGYMRMSADRTDLYLTLFNGYVHDYDRTQTALFRRIFFQTDFVRVQNVSNQLERTEENEFRSDREMTICEMETVVQGDQRGLEQIRREIRVAVENDVRRLLDAPGVEAARDTATLPRRRTLTGAYCGATAGLAALLRPAPPADSSPGGAGGPGAAATGTGATTTTAPAAAEARPMFQRSPTPSREAGEVEPDRIQGQLRVLAARHRTARLHSAIYQVEIHKKFSIAASCIVFVLIGAPVALRFPRGGVGLVIGASVAIFGFYYIGLIGGETLADQLIITPFWSMWGPNLLMTAAGVVLFLRLGREHATARGGGLADALARRRRARQARRADKERRRAAERMRAA